MTRASTVRARRGEHGSGLLPSVLGLCVLLGMLGLTVNVALGLWARSTTESIAYETARAVATAPPGSDEPTERADAIARACTVLASRCREVSLDFRGPATGTTEFVELHVQAPGVRLLPRMLADGGPVVSRLDRVVRIRREGR